MSRLWINGRKVFAKLKASRLLPQEATGIFLVVGSAVGAGMLSLPIAASGMWFGYAVLLLLVTCLMMGASSLLILESNLHFPSGASFDTVVRRILGPGWNLVNGLAVAFVLYILTYAYISGGGSIFSRMPGVTLPQWIASIVFTLPLAGLVWSGTSLVGRATGIALGGMLASFVLAIANLSLSLELAVLFESQQSGAEPPRFFYVFAAVPLFLISFGFHGVIPSLAKFYRGDGRTVARCIVAGCAVTLLVYFLWLASVFGNIPRAQFGDLVAAGGNIGHLSDALQQVSRHAWVTRLFEAFANFAVVSSLLAVSLGLFDYLADLLQFDDSAVGRLKTVLMAFAPPLVCAVFFPDGFVHAIGYAGLAAVIWGVLVPALTARKARQLFPDAPFRVLGGDSLCFLLLGYAGLVVSCQLAVMCDLLPVYGG